MSTTESQTYIPRLPNGELDRNAFIDLKTASKISFLSKQTLWRLLQSGALTRYKIAPTDRTLIKIGELLSLIKAQE